MLEMLAITLPIFILIGAGFLAAFSGLVIRDNMQGIATRCGAGPVAPARPSENRRRSSWR